VLYREIRKEWFSVHECRIRRAIEAVDLKRDRKRERKKKIKEAFHMSTL